jgi:LPS-assembly lipoprotein
MTERKYLPLSFTRRSSLAMLGAAVSLGGCGFTPLYGERGAAAAPDVIDAMAQVSIRSLPNREGMKLRQVLREGLQPRGTTNVVYDLDVSLATRVEELGIRPDATSSRANLIMLATFRLNEGGVQVYGDRVQSIVSYNILDDQYATVASQADAENRGIKQIGQEIKTRLAVYFHDRLEKSASVASAKP